VVSAAAVLDLGVRQTFHLMSRYQGGRSWCADPPGSWQSFQSPVERWHPGVCGGTGVNEVCRLWPYPATEVLQEKHSITTGRETLR
jgi:hypothetical protein